MTSGYTNKFRFSASEICSLSETYKGRCEISREIERFRRLNGMRTGLNLTDGEMKSEALHWANHPE